MVNVGFSMFNQFDHCFRTLIFPLVIFFKLSFKHAKYIFIRTFYFAKAQHTSIVTVLVLIIITIVINVCYLK